MSGLIHHDPDSIPDFVEVDPTGRYGRYNEVLGKGSSKTVFRAFDEYDGIEVAWNQVKPNDFLRSSQDLERLYCEIHLLKTLKHNNIMKIYASWVDTSTRNINFITEIFTSGTLRQYMLRHRKVNIRAVKHWCQQILRGLHYLHSHDPPVIHRDLKCDNIFINGNHGEVKIGDLGLAAFLRKSYAEHCVGTPEFMAPEVYNEEYNELVDVYSFGMCVLEMVTLEFPYSECTTPAQIYKKVISGKKPDAFYKVEDPEVRNFVEKCLATASLRLTARELLEDPFLEMVEHQSNSVLLECQKGFGGIRVIPQHPLGDNHFTVECSGFNSEGDNMEIKPTGIELFEYEEDENMHRVDIGIKGQRSEDGRIFLRLRIVDKEEWIRNIYFSFDLEKDTALSVATEMVSELDLSDHHEITIAKMIDGEIAALVPEWRSEASMDDDPWFTYVGDSLNFIADYTSDDYLRSHNRSLSNCTVATHGRFEEIVYHLENGSEQEVMDDAPSVEFSSSGRRENHSDDEHEDLNPNTLMADTGELGMENTAALNTMVSLDSHKPSLSSTQKDDEDRIDGTCPTSCVYDNETCNVDGQPRERRSFPKVGSLKIQDYKQMSAISKHISIISSFSCLPRTSSALVDDSDAWSLYCDFLHSSF